MSSRRTLPILFLLVLACAAPAQALQLFHGRGLQLETSGSIIIGPWTPPPVPPIDPPPRDLALESDTGTFVEIGYSCAGGADSYAYFRREAEGAWKRHSGGVCVGARGRIPDPFVLPRQDYCYYVVAKNDRHTSPASETLCITTGGIPRVPARSDLDRPAPSDPRAEIEMATGRESKIPASWFWKSPGTLFRGGAFAGDHDVVFRAQCSIPLTEAGRCDTGMLVSFERCEPGAGCTQPTTLYNDDDPDPRTHGGGSGSGSFVDPPRQPNGVSGYTVTVFSQLRATSRVRVEYSLDGGARWTTATGELEVGGALVKVGALAPGDHLEVESLNDGADGADTHMLLFRPNADTGVLYSTDRSGSDGDPLIRVENDDFARAAGFVLIGKERLDSSESLRADALEGVETWVDLVHGPRSDTRSVSRTACSGPCGASLEAGRYLLWTYAAIDRPVGSVDPGDPASFHSSGDMPVVEMCKQPNSSQFVPCKECPNDARDGLGEATWYRGQQNDVVLSLDLQRRVCGRLGKGTCHWQTVRSRDITRAVLGADPDGGGWNVLSMELAADAPGHYRLSTREHVAGLRFYRSWRYQRNPDATELKVVSFNTYFSDNHFNTAKYRNTANLVGNRGRVHRQDGRVEMRHDQAPFQWEADIVALQEVGKVPDGNGPDLTYTDAMDDELFRTGSLPWDYAIGRGESWTTGWGEGPGMNSTFVNALHRPETSIWFSPRAKDAGDCSTKGYGRIYAECELDESGIGHGEVKNFATPAKARARRSEGDDRPISIFNVHLEASDGPADFRARLGELDSLIETIDAMLAAEPEAFNREGSANPRHYQNRIVILGDWNIRCHYCGEHYWLLRALREHYGYAVDTSMAVLDANGIPSFGMHEQGHPIGNDGAPTRFQHQEHGDLRSPAAWQGWRDAPNHFGSSVYPWWAADYRGQTSGARGVGERLSAVMLVGRGWAYDDPVLDYRLMNDRAWTSPMHESPAAVEMWRPDDCDDGGSVALGAGGYAPNHSLGCNDSGHGGLRAGAPALHTDHKPIGVRLRVWLR